MKVRWLLILSFVLLFTAAYLINQNKDEFKTAFLEVSRNAESVFPEAGKRINSSHAAFSELAAAESSFLINLPENQEQLKSDMSELRSCSEKLKDALKQCRDLLSESKLDVYAFESLNKLVEKHFSEISSLEVYASEKIRLNEDYKREKESCAAFENAVEVKCALNESYYLRISDFEKNVKNKNTDLLEKIQEINEEFAKAANNIGDLQQKFIQKSSVKISELSSADYSYSWILILIISLMLIIVFFVHKFSVNSLRLFIEEAESNIQKGKISLNVSNDNVYPDFLPHAAVLNKNFSAYGKILHGLSGQINSLISGNFESSSLKDQNGEISQIGNKLLSADSNLITLEKSLTELSELCLEGKFAESDFSSKNLDGRFLGMADKIMQMKEFMEKFPDMFSFPIFVLDNNLCFVYSNKVFSTFFGTTRGGVSGKKYNSLIKPSEASNSDDCPVKKVFQRKNPACVKTDLLVQGKVISVRFGAVPLKNSSGELSGILCYVTD
ncbi:MAG: PAS domain-containing protein [Candidatus Riflebacteria bacterium]|nr:PAS domain-containing protein [Candidatus Riflebacteria bacterium]